MGRSGETMASLATAARGALAQVHDSVIRRIRLKMSSFRGCTDGDANISASNQAILNRECTRLRRAFGAAGRERTRIKSHAKPRREEGIRNSRKRTQGTQKITANAREIESHTKA
jgi:hypothetical protein